MSLGPSEYLSKHGQRVAFLPSPEPTSCFLNGDTFMNEDLIPDSQSQHLCSSPPLSELSSTYSNLGTWNPSRLLGEHTYVPMTVSDENNYLTYDYDVCDIDSSLLALSAFPSNPSSPSMSTMSTSTEGSPQLSSLPLAEFGYTFGTDYNTSLSNDVPLVSHTYSQWSEAPARQHTQMLLPKAFVHHSRPSPAQSPVSPEKFKSRPGRSRESSPNQSDCDQNNPRRRYPCLILGCTRRFTSQYTLKVHMEAHKPKPRVTFPCTLGCSEKFSRQHDRLRHEVAKHGKICEFSCEHCGRFFSTKKTLGNHKCPVAQGTRWVDN